MGNFQHVHPVIWKWPFSLLSALVHTYWCIYIGYSLMFLFYHLGHSLREKWMGGWLDGERERQRGRLTTWIVLRMCGNKVSDNREYTTSFSLRFLVSGFPGGSVVKNACNAGPWVRKNPWRKECLPTPVFLPGETYGQRIQVGYSPWGRKESDTAEQHFFLLLPCLIGLWFHFLCLNPGPATY